jgi:hypothetical protein
MNAIALSILGVCLGHPSITNKEITGYPKAKVSSELEELDNAFDDYAYDFGWRPWEWEPGLCINCLRDLMRDQDGACEQCGWFQGGN